MFRSWMLIPALAVGLAIGGGTTYMVVGVEKPANPLLSATLYDFNTFVSEYFLPCQQILFGGNDPKGQYDLCARHAITQVRDMTGVYLSAEDLRDARVKARWIAVTGEK
ncbi:hypothetical protein QTH87_21560 [Variovorax sp. J22P168]|uniref:hypothetical protein n=1 Tax=Variovorax jilinensis TaxID=3053513 RepID=UPI002574CB1A|nr:hypothetical protein [Variovorax sp. J22P168]MDM0015047.1 hypothetical protein [Variovorax sp. J22P168]